MAASSRSSCRRGRPGSKVSTIGSSASMPGASRSARSRRICKSFQAAARQFREKGIAATGLAELMKAAGLTHGGFYKHDMRRWRWGFPAPFPTSFANSPKRTCDQPGSAATRRCDYRGRCRGRRGAQPADPWQQPARNSLASDGGRAPRKPAASSGRVVRPDHRSSGRPRIRPLYRRQRSMGSASQRWRRLATAHLPVSLLAAARAHPGAGSASGHTASRSVATASSE
jgi:hypothetical protein